MGCVERMYVADVPGIEPWTGAIAGPEPACAKTCPPRRTSTRAIWSSQQRLQRGAGGGRVAAVDRVGEGGGALHAVHRLRDVAAGGGLVVDARGDRAERVGDRRRAVRGGGSGRGRCGRGRGRAGGCRAGGGARGRARRCGARGEDADALAALWVAAADEPQPTSATARQARRSRPGRRLLAAS